MNVRTGDGSDFPPNIDGEPHPSPACIDLLGPAPRVTFTRDTGHTTVRRWEGTAGHLYEKVHQDPARLEREHRALTTWAAELEQSPRVLHRSANALLLEALPGRSLSTTPPSGAEWTAVGRWLRRAHASPDVPVDPLPVSTALNRRWQRLLKRSERLVETSVIRACVDIIGDPTALATERVWCHRDFTPDNWLGDGTSVWILDFEHSRTDIPWSDLVKLEAEYFPQNNAARAAFMEGYGALPTPEHRTAHVAWHGLATLTWGLRNWDAGFMSLGERALRSVGIEAFRPMTPVPSDDHRPPPR